MLFNKRSQKAIKAMWGVLAVLIIIGMVMIYIPL
jgi:hypothetical protein